MGRSPHGERGLKFVGSLTGGLRKRSLSSRRAWIEINVTHFNHLLCVVALLTESVD